MNIKLNSKQKFELKKFVKELEIHKGRHTELVSVYIPQGYDLNKITTHLSQEQGTATNIKSKQTRDNVISSLEKMLQHLKLFKRTPPNGLAIFSGNVSEKEGHDDFKVWSIEPAIPIKIRMYQCDKTFVLDHLKDLLDDEDIFGMVVMDKREANVAILKGKTIISLSHATSNVPGKTRAGGQSAQRFARLREGAAKDFYKKVADMMKEQFLDKKEVKGILVGGPGHTKQDFVDRDYINNDIKSKIITMQDLSYTGDFGLQELLAKSEDVLSNEEVSKEKKIVNLFFTILAKEEKKAAYGIADCEKALEMGAVDTLLISESMDEKKIEELETRSEQFGTKVELISIETREGSQLKDFGKIAAILRYEI
jgi:peptide chain release factor subunit 1